MWIFSIHGNFSCVFKENDAGAMCYHLRSRVKEDIERLRKAANLELPIIGKEDSDYRWRLLVPAEDFPKIMQVFGDSVTYPHFGQALENEGQLDRLGIYHRVWLVLSRLH